MPSQDEDKKEQSNQDRLQRIAPNRTRSQKVDEDYSKFIRTMKMALPLLAVILTVVVFVLSTGDETAPPTPKNPTEETQTIGKNELLAPQFDSLDTKNQPYTITAKRAIQGETDDNLVILEEPVGEITLENGTHISVRADQGAYRQDNQRLLLKGNVIIKHDQGYELITETLDIDIGENLFWSKEPVKGSGPAGTIDALGIRGDMETGLLIFEGRAKMILRDTNVLGNAFKGKKE